MRLALKHRANGAHRSEYTLDASDEVLIRHKENDDTRSRNFFEHHLKYMMPLKRKWFIGRENVDVLMVDDLSADEVGVKVKEWCDDCIKKYGAVVEINEILYNGYHKLEMAEELWKR